MAALILLQIFVRMLALARTTRAATSPNRPFTVNFDLYPKDHGHFAGENLKIDKLLVDKCIPFSGIYNLTAPSRPETVYIPPEQVPAQFDLRLYQDDDCLKPVYEDGWPWTPDLEGEDWDYVFGYYKLTRAQHPGKQPGQQALEPATSPPMGAESS
ncbi:hypothetical protein TWF281_001585 [Arthrobotrys megalospora]